MAVACPRKGQRPKGVRWHQKVSISYAYVQMSLVTANDVINSNW
jgi:hypothetical protein